MSHRMTADLKQCMTDCHECHVACLSTAMTHCLEMGGKHTEPAHFRLMMDCAQICATALDFMARGSEHHPHICRECAEICRTCAASCAGLDGMEQCAAACRKCAESCETMVA